jgi:chromosome segregation ATPase
MAEVCKDIDKGLSDLNAAINRLNNRLDGLERKQNECCNNKDKNKPTDLSAILKRLDKAEKDILELGGVVKTIIDDFKDVLDLLDEHNQNASESQNIFSGILDFFINE